MQNNEFKYINESKSWVDFQEDEIFEALFSRNEKVFFDVKVPEKFVRQDSHPFFLPLAQTFFLLMLILGFAVKAQADFDFKSAVAQFNSELNNYHNMQLLAVVACVWDTSDSDIRNNLDRREEFKDELSFDFRSTLAYLLFMDKTLDELTPIFNSLVLEKLEKYPCPDSQRTSAVKVLDLMFRSALSPQLPSTPNPKEAQMRSQSPYLSNPLESNRESQSGIFRGVRRPPLDSAN